MEQTGGIPKAFREHFARHNQQALALGIFTLIGTVLLWVAAYIAIYWLVLLALTATQGVDAYVPASFLPIFGACAVFLCIIALIVRRFNRSWLPVENKSKFENFMDIVLAIPRATFEVWGNFSALRFLSEQELQAAWELLQLIGRERRLSIHILPVEIPDPALRARVVFVLQLAQLIELRKDESGLWLVLQGDKARRLSRIGIRIDPPLPRSPMEPPL